MNGEVEPRAIVPRVRRSVGKDHPTLVPALIALADIREIYATLAIRTVAVSTAPLVVSIVQQVYATLVVALGRYAPVVPREHRASLKH